MKKAFTMIELIFVIVIIGILAAVAIPKLAATRDDAKIVKEMANLSQCVSDLGGKYTAEGNFTTSSPDSIDACRHFECFIVTTPDVNGTVNVANKSGTPSFCIDAQNLAVTRQLDGNHSFGDKKIIF